MADGTDTLPAWFFARNTMPTDVKRVPPQEAARAKARELLAIYDDWALKGGCEPKPKRERRSSALLKAEKALDRISDMQDDIAWAVAAIPALTMAGIRVKLAIVAGDSDNDGTGRFSTTHQPLVAVLHSAAQDIARIEIGTRLNPPSLKETLVASLQEGVRHG